jgi:hypothetical protein
MGHGGVGGDDVLGGPGSVVDVAGAGRAGSVRLIGGGVEEWQTRQDRQDRAGQAAWWMARRKTRWERMQGDTASAGGQTESSNAT